MKPNEFSNTITPRYYKNDEQYTYFVKYPAYLSITGNLAVSVRNDEAGVQAFLIWPTLFGEQQYGLMILEEVTYMNKTLFAKNSETYLLRWFLFFGIVAVMFFSFFVFQTSVPDETAEKKPVLSNVVGIAFDGESVYTVDDTFNAICKYRDNGEFVYRIRFSTFGTNYIFCDSDGRLCRYDLKKETVYVYDAAGKISDEYLADGIEHTFRKEQTVGDKVCTLHSHRLINSTVEINDGTKTERFVVEGLLNHIVRLLLIAVFAGCAIIAAVNLFIFIYKMKVK